MKTSLALASSLTVLLATSAASAAQDAYKAVLNGEQETPSNAVAGTGTTKNLVYDTVTKKLTGEVDFTGLSGAPTMQHIHEEQCGVSGAVLYPLPNPNNNKITINQALTAADLTALTAGKLYINIHTAAHPGGEIRGQIYPAASALVCLGANDGGLPDAAADSSTDSGHEGGTSGSSGTSGTSGGTSGATSGGTSGATSGGTSGATSGGTSGGTSGSADGGSGGGGGDSGGGCATASSDTTSSNVALLALAGLGVAVVVRSRRKSDKAGTKKTRR